MHYFITGKTQVIFISNKLRYVLNKLNYNLIYLCRKLKIHNKLNDHIKLNIESVKRRQWDLYISFVLIINSAYIVWRSRIQTTNLSCYKDQFRKVPNNNNYERNLTYSMYGHGKTFFRIEDVKTYSKKGLRVTRLNYKRRRRLVNKNKNFSFYPKLRGYNNHVKLINLRKFKLVGA